MADFDSAKLWITQAREDLQDFRTREQSAFGQEAYTPFEDLDREPGAKVVGLRLKPVPETLSTRAANIVGALRSALDQATWRASVVLGASEDEKIYFPFAGTEEDFDALFTPKGRAKNIPAALHPFLQKLKAHPGGNRLLYALSRISNPNKHTVTYRVGIEFGHAAAGSFAFDGMCYEATLPPRWDAAKNELIFGIVALNANIHYDLRMPFFVAFGEVPIVGGQPVVPILDNFLSIVEGIVAGIEAEAIRLSGR